MAGSAPHIPGCRDLSLIGERVARSLFSAYSDRVGRPVTVTVFPPLSEGRTSAGFDDAATTAQRLGAHPSVLTIHEWGHAPDGRPWIVTDPQPAESVDTLLTMDGPLDVDRAVRVGILLAGALETAHRAGIVHGDLQPGRLVFGAQGEPLLVETGLAAFAVFPGLGALNNPVRYHAPPEVLERTDVTPATDVYSLATTVYALIAGRAPQQKPAEITDSNASLLLRILQMPVPRIERPDLPAGLEDALLGPLSPSPGKRPQQAIEVAWLLQDVQRRNGLAVTEPVVLDLDDLSRGGSGATVAPVAAPPSLIAPPPEPAWPSADAEPALPSADAEPAWPTADPQAPWPTTDPQSSWPTGQPGPAAAPDLAAEPEPDPLPPTIFPFAEGRPGAPPASPNPFGPRPEPAAADELLPSNPWGDAGAPENGEAVWPTTWPADQAPAEGADTLWPSTWPADAPGDAPAWAATPVTDDEIHAVTGFEGDTTARPPRAEGDDGGSIGDLPGFSAGNGDNGGGPATAFEAIQRPPELDELPAWYTDPLPNRPGDAPGNGSGLADAAPSAPWSTPTRPDGDVSPPGWPGGDVSPPGWPGGDVSPPAVAGTGWPAGEPARPAPPTPHPGNGAAPGTPDAGPWNPPPARSRADAYKLPGAGDELRSLFGEVVGGEDDQAPPERPPALPSIHAHGAPDHDPLGPPQARPPIDLSQLDRPLGPAPYLPPGSSPSDTGAPAARTGGHPDDRPPTRLPRRGEANTWTSPTARSAPEGPVRLPRASDPGDDAGAAPRPPRPGPRQVAPVAGSGPAGGPRPASAGPPALPLIILIGVVLVLALGVAWLVLAGDDSGPPASDRPGASADAGAAGPTDVAVNEVPEGVQVTWSGRDDASYVVTVLSTTVPPSPLPPTIGTSALVPNVDGAPSGPRCFTVALSDPTDPAATAPPSGTACTAGATPDQMQQG
jgi:serine/threonine protein kinase